MYIIAIGWLYVILMMAATESSIIGGILTFLFYGIFPCGLLLWIIGTPQRLLSRLAKPAEEPLGKPDGADAEADQHHLL